MRKVLVLPVAAALLVGSAASVSAVATVPVAGLLTGAFGIAKTPATDLTPATVLTLSPEADPSDDGHDHSTHDHSVEGPAGNDAASAALDSPATDHLPDNDHAKGLVFDGLRPGAPNGSCGGAFEIALPDGTAMCTHGPDAAPPGLDVRAERSVADLAEATANTDTSGTAAETGAGVPCIGDGVSGNRVQAIYAVSADRTDRYAEIAALIPGWAAAVDDVFSHSAAQVGGERHVRFVTDAGCGLDIAHVVLSATGDDNIMNTINELVAAGYGRADRKYLIWTDAAIYCGIAQIFSDDRPGQDNLSNVRSGFARVDQGCWGGTYSSEAHELVHSLGGVQPTAPHASANFHCTDEEDRMCYKDGVDVVLTFDCPVDNAHYLDCNHDDYYHPSPPAGSYLDTHWNVADSSFLHAGPIGDPPPPPTNAPPVVSAAAPASVTLGGGASLDGTVSDDGLPGPYTVVWSQTTGPGEATFAAATSEDTTVSFSAAGVYVLTLTADDGELTGASSVTVTVDPEAPPNAPPVVSAAAPPSVTLGNGASLDGTVSDDGMPGPYAVAWSRASGPGAVTFTNATAEDTSVSFSMAGVYVLTLTADDGQLTGASSVTITVEPAPPPDPTSTTDVFTGSISRKRPTATFETTVATGSADAVLSFNSARGKKATSLQLTLNVYDANGVLVATSTGPSTVTLAVTLGAGSYTWEVTGANTSFSLEVTHMVT